MRIINILFMFLLWLFLSCLLCGLFYAEESEQYTYTEEEF